MLGLAVRAIAGDGEMQVSYAPGKPELDGKTVQLPEPSRVPSAKEIAVIRGWADSLALTAACHDAKLHSRLAPRSGPAKAVFEAVERARIEALGANRMPGMAANLTARVEDQYGHGRYAEITDRADAPLEDALALIVREQLTGAAPPKTAKAMVDLWRPWIEERAGRTLSQLTQLAEDQAAFGQVMRDVLKTLDLSDEPPRASARKARTSRSPRRATSRPRSRRKARRPRTQQPARSSAARARRASRSSRRRTPTSTSRRPTPTSRR